MPDLPLPLPAPDPGLNDRSARLRGMLEAPILPTLLRMSWPNLLMMLAQSSTGLVEMWLLSRLGTHVLAGVAVVVPVLMLMQNMSQGAMGGGISSAVARALGGGDARLADSLARHAVVLSAAIGLLFTIGLLAVNEPLLRLLGATDKALHAATAYSRPLFAGLALMWVMNALASVVRGTGNMAVPGAVICGGALLLVPTCAALVYGFGPVPALGPAGGAYALVLYYGVGAAVLAWYCMSGRNAATLSRGALQWAPVRRILAVGGPACLNPLLTNGLIGSTAALVGAFAGTEALAGYATAARLEYLLMPIAFGLGAPMVALVSANVGAGQLARARRIALAGGAVAFVLGELVGISAAIWPTAWLQLFASDERLLETGTHYLRIAGPFYGFFALGFSLYFASQGAGRLKWPLCAGALRLGLAAGLGGAVLFATGSLTAFFVLGAVAMTLYGLLVLWSVSGANWPAEWGRKADTGAGRTDVAISRADPERRKACMNDSNGSKESTPLEITQASLQVKEDTQATQPPAPMAPGDEVAPDSPGSAEGICPACGGSGRRADSSVTCEVCEGSGKVQVGVGGG